MLRQTIPLCRSLFGSQDIITLIRPVVENMYVYLGEALTHLNHLDRFQTRIENMCGLTTFP